MNIIAEVRELKEKLIAYRRHFHQYPEPSLKEYKTADTIQNILKELEIPFIKVGETGTFASIQGTKESTEPLQQIILRADIDALDILEKSSHDYRSKNSGVMHACGHDAHTAALLGAVHYFKEHPETFSGTIHFAFQQAEEIGAGAKQFVAAGLTNDVNQVFGLHVDPNLELGEIQAVPGPNNASCDIFTIDITGKSTHVARPQLGVDALVIGANIVTKLQQIPSRLTDPMEGIIVGIGKFESGTRYNIVANHAHLEGTLRTLSRESRVRFLQLIQQIAEDEATFLGGECTFSNYDAANVTINDSESTERAQRIAQRLVSEENVITHLEPSMGADDFADFLAEVPGCYLRVGVRSSSDTSYGLHHEQFDLDEEALLLMTQLHIDYALDFLNE
ncbi:amidohydrolase [Aerococcaceae bacterium DSM 111020]|nr:amidohydrolase [Aerococcaceae bacterium DSM 111020]